MLQMIIALQRQVSELRADLAALKPD
jgi:hypothetical protein